MKIKLNNIAAYLATRLPFISSYTLGFGWAGKYIKHWYENNKVFKFKPGDEIELKGQAFGYGLRPQGVIVECVDGRYIVDMTSDDDGDWHRLVNEGYVPDGVTRSTERQTHFKWNIEHQFRPLRNHTQDPALVTA